MTTLNGKRKTCYRCAECGKTVAVDASGAFLRSCSHEEAGVTAGVSATTYGQGGALVKEATPQ